MRLGGEEGAMKAIVQEGYGSPDDVLHLRDVAPPVPQDDEVLVQVYAASVHPDVWHMVHGRPYVLRLMGAGRSGPKTPIPGTDLAGRVESVGAAVTRFRPRDEVFGESVRGYQWRNGGAYAEYAAVHEESLASKPATVSFEQAASVPTSALIALQNLRGPAKVRAGQRVLINGAAGGVGAFAVQLAKAEGAEVTGVDSTDKLDLLRSIGADRVIDFTRQDYTTDGQRYDLILDIPGNHPFSEVRRALTPTGCYVLIGHDGYGASAGRWLGSLRRFLKLIVISPFVKQLPPLDFSSPNKRAAMAQVKELLESGKVTPVIDSTFPLSEVPQAIRYLEEGRARGKIVITVGE
jgi:NADPH:quinone reductase-like Zn-dependent oxidoreductase